MRLGSPFVTAVICLSLAGSSLAVAQIVSDDFNAYNLKTSLWTFTDPMGDATLTLNGTGTSSATLSLTVPAGASHELWTTGYDIPRIMQPAPNTDFEVEVKFQSDVTQLYQMQGVVVEQDSANLLRIEYNSAGAGVNIFAASFSGGLGSPVTRLSSALGTLTQPLYLRINRTGSNWTISYSTDGNVWTPAGNFAHTMTVNKIGVFAGNSGGGAAPAHTAVVDYFFNTVSPVSPEDPGSVVDNTGPLVYDVKVVPAGTGLRVTWKTDEPATGSVEFGKTLTYEGGAQSHLGTGITHEVVLSDLTPGTLYNVRITSNDNHPNNATTTGNFIATTVAAATIDVWYGKSQTFGSVGNPQRNADILGNVSGPRRVVSLSYTLNGGASKDLSIGPDGHLLELPGDFKINLPYASLQNGANTVVITAIDSLSALSRDTVTVIRAASAVWPLPYAVNWSGSTSLTDSAQVVDGKWERTGQGAHIIQSGYDRDIVIGDTTWTDYEVSAELTVHRIDSTAEAFDPGNGGPAIGIMLRWVGHTDNPIFTPPITQPLTGYLPLGAIGWYHWRNAFASTDSNRWELNGNNLTLRDANADPSNALLYDTKYVLKMQVATVAGSQGFYRLKFWQAGLAEPDSWLLSGLESATDPQYGSILILAHHVEATIGRVTVTPLGPDAIGPLFGDIHADPGAHSAYITWGTNEPGTTRVAYGTTSAHADTVSGGSSLTYAHAVLLTGLSPNTQYHYVLISTDSAGNRSVSADSVFTTLASPPPSTFVSDEFDADSLNPAIWTFVNPPPGGATIAKQPTTISLHVPGGVAHDLWTNGYAVPRLVQSVNNTDFDIEIKFDSPLGPQYQMQGLVIEQDSANVIRLDFNGNGTQTRIFAATFTGGFSSPVVLADSLVGGTGILPLMMRIKREDNGWTLSYSLNGTLWTTVASFHHIMTARKIGIFAGNAGSSPPTFDAIVDYIRNNGAGGSSARVSIKVLLEGAYAPSLDTMRTRLTSVMPLQQPYSGAPWNYPGTETITSVPGSVVDWILVELRADTTNPSTVTRRAGLLKKDGSVVDLNGSSPLVFPEVGSGQFYIVARHRNHLAIMSAAPVTIDSNAVLYDFSTAQNKAFGPNAMKSVGSRFALFGGDANMDGQVTSLDFDQFNPKFRGAATGYQAVDWNLDGQVTSPDFDLFNPNFRAAAVCRVPN